MKKPFPRVKKGSVSYGGETEITFEVVNSGILRTFLFEPHPPDEEVSPEASRRLDAEASTALKDILLGDIQRQLERMERLIEDPAQYVYCADGGPPERVPLKYPPPPTYRHQLKLIRELTSSIPKRPTLWEAFLRGFELGREVTRLDLATIYEPMVQIGIRTREGGREKHPRKSGIDFAVAKTLWQNYHPANANQLARLYAKVMRGLPKTAASKRGGRRRTIQFASLVRKLRTQIRVWTADDRS